MSNSAFIKQALLSNKHVAYFVSFKSLPAQFQQVAYLLSFNM